MPTSKIQQVLQNWEKHVSLECVDTKYIVHVEGPRLNALFVTGVRITSALVVATEGSVSEALHPHPA